MVGNGVFIKCQGICPVVDISLQKITFISPFYLLPIEGVDVVLGIDGLSTLKSFKAYFLVTNIAFTNKNHQITLQAHTSSTPPTTTYQQCCQYVSTNSISSLHLLFVEPHPMLPSFVNTKIHNPSSPLYTLPHPSNLSSNITSIFLRPQYGLPP